MGPDGAMLGAMARRKGSMVGISGLIPKVYPAGEPPEMQVMRLMGSWGKVVNPRVLRNARPVHFRHGVLTVHTATSAWADALSLDSEELLAKLRARVSGLRIRSLRFRTGPLPELPEQFREVKRPPLLPLEQLPEELARALAHVQDDRLRDAIQTAARATLGRAAQPPATTGSDED